MNYRGANAAFAGFMQGFEFGQGIKREKEDKADRQEARMVAREDRQYTRTRRDRQTKVLDPRDDEKYADDRARLEPIPDLQRRRQLGLRSLEQGVEGGDYEAATRIPVAQKQQMNTIGLRNAEVGLDNSRLALGLNKHKLDALPSIEQEREATGLELTSKREAIETTRENRRLAGVKATQYGDYLKQRGAGSAGGGIKAPSGYRFQQNGNLEFIPGGPHDPKSRGGSGSKQNDNLAFIAREVYGGDVNKAFQAVRGGDPTATVVRVADAMMDAQKYAPRQDRKSYDQVFELAKAKVSKARDQAFNVGAGATGISDEGEGEGEAADDPDFDRRIDALMGFGDEEEEP